MEEISQMQQKRSLVKCSKQDVEENPHMRWVQSIIAGLGKDRVIFRNWAGSSKCWSQPLTNIWGENEDFCHLT